MKALLAIFVYLFLVSALGFVMVVANGHDNPAVDGLDDEDIF